MLQLAKQNAVLSKPQPGEFTTSKDNATHGEQHDMTTFNDTKALSAVTAIAAALGATVEQSSGNSGTEGYRLTMNDDHTVKLFVSVKTGTMTAYATGLTPRGFDGAQHTYGFSEVERELLSQVPDKVGFTATRDPASIARTIDNRLLTPLRPALRIYAAKDLRERLAAESLVKKAIEFETYVSGDPERAREKVERFGINPGSLKLGSVTGGATYTITGAGISNIDITRLLTTDQAKQVIDLLKSFESN